MSCDNYLIGDSFSTNRDTAQASVKSVSVPLEHLHQSGLEGAIQCPIDPPFLRRP